MDNPSGTSDTGSPEAGPSTATAPAKIDLVNMKAFARPQHGAPSHPILSSPFARRIAIAASYPSKPLWYKELDTFQYSLFKELLSVVDLERGKYVNLQQVLEILQDLDPTVTRDEVRDIILELDRDKSGVLDLGEFLYALANSEHYRRFSTTNLVYKKLAALTPYTPRQRLFYSAMAYFVFCQSPADIDRYYYNKHLLKGDALRFHMESARLGGLSEKEMELRQMEARFWGMALRETSESTYAKPVPFVPAFAHDRAYAYYLALKEKSLKSPSYVYNLKKPVQRPIKQFKVKRELGDPVVHGNRNEEIIQQFQDAKISMPEMRMPESKCWTLRNKVYEDSRSYLNRVAAKGMEEYHGNLREGNVLFARKAMKFQYAKKFPSGSLAMRYYNIFRTYMPLQEKPAHILFPWTPPTMWMNPRPIPKVNRPPFGRASD